MFTIRKLSKGIKKQRLTIKGFKSKDEYVVWWEENKPLNMPKDFYWFYSGYGKKRVARERKRK